VTSFLFAFLNFFQPGIFWPDLADYRPMQVAGGLAILASLGSSATFRRVDALRHPAIKWLFAFLLVQVVSVYRSGLAAVVSEAGFWLAYALFIVVTLRIVADVGSLRRYVWGMMCGSLWIVGWGIHAVFNGLAEANGGRAGAYGMYENHNDYSFIIVQSLPFFYVYWRTDSGFLRRSLLGLAVLACVAGTFLSLSRGGMMALVLECVLIVWYAMDKRKRVWLLPLVLAFGAAAISYQYIKRAQNQGDNYTAEDAESSRLELWQAGKAMFLAHPFLGVGSRTFGENATSYGEISHDNLGKNAHNTLIEAAATTGLFGFTALVMMLVRAIQSLRRPPDPTATPWEESTRKATLIALYTLIFRSLFDAKTWDWSFYVLVAIAALLAALRLSREERQRTDAARVQDAESPRPFGNMIT
jgi:O-antigen ligase